MQQFGEPPITPPEPPTWNTCDKCHEPIEIGEEAYFMEACYIDAKESQIYCEDCLSEWFKDLQRETIITEEEE